jgi:type VI secretion system protein ImpL
MSLILCLFFVVFLITAFMSDRRIYHATDAVLCTAIVDQSGTRSHLEQVDRCRQAVQQLGEWNHQRSWSSRLLLNRSGGLELQLRQRYVEQFASGVLAGLDTSLSQRLNTGSDTIPLVFLLIKRIELLNQCLSRFGCPKTIEKELRPDYQLMLDPRPQPSASVEQVTQLQDTYEAYLRWASEGTETVLRRELEAHTERLRYWFATKQFALRQIVPWANQHYAPITLQEYWEDIPATDVRKATQVDGAYTAGAWKQSILPFLQRAEEAVPDMAPLLREFQEEYRAQYFKQWREFLVEFPRGEALSREARRRLASKFLDENSPYNRILDVVFAQLKPLLPAVMILEGTLAGAAEVKPGQPVSWLEKAKRTISQWWENGGTVSVTGGIKDAVTATVPEPALPNWVRILHHYIRSESRKAYLDALKQMRDLLAGATSTEKSFQIVQAAFQEGKPTEKSLQPVLKAWWIISQFREQQKFDEASEAFFWPLLEQPVLFAWEMILEDAGKYLQDRWVQNVLIPMKALSPQEQLNSLYGAQGKVWTFIDQWVKPFLTQDDTHLGKVLGSEMPLSSEFLRTLRDKQELIQIFTSDRKILHQVRIEATRNSFIDSETPLIEEKTELQLECDSKLYRITHPSQGPFEAKTTIFWSPDTCGDVTITIFVSCDQSCVERAAAMGFSIPAMSSLRLAKRYTGQAAFLNFIRDFHDGSHELSMTDLIDSTDTVQQYHVHAIKVYYRIDFSSALAKLIALIPDPIVATNIIK